MKIGIIGAGNIGGTLGRHWVAAGHEVIFGVRSPAALGQLLRELGAKASAGSGAEAARLGEVLVFAGPFGAWPKFAESSHGALSGKVVIDAANPYPERDGALAEKLIKAGTGSALYVASLLPDSLIVRAFNTVYWVDLRDQAHAHPPLAMPLAGNDLKAIGLASQLALDAGFEPVIVGDLTRGVALDPGSPIYGKSLTAELIRKTLGLKA